MEKRFPEHIELIAWASLFGFSMLVATVGILVVSIKMAGLVP
jgi:hypothetical protein